jgi:hypothetical protein
MTTWYPPSAGTGGFVLANPPFSQMKSSQKTPAFFINDRFGCIGRFRWFNTIQQPRYPYPTVTPLWGAIHWWA